MDKQDILQGRLFYVLRSHRKGVIALLAVLILAVGAVVIVSNRPAGGAAQAGALAGDPTAVPSTLTSGNFGAKVLPNGACAITAWKGSRTSVMLPKGLTTLAVMPSPTAGTSRPSPLPASLTDLSTHAFCGCKVLRSITVPGSVKGILEEGVETIGGDAFMHCIPPFLRRLKGRFPTCGRRLFPCVFPGTFWQKIISLRP